MSIGSHGSDPKRIKLDFNEVNEPGPSTTASNTNLDEILNSPSDTCENTSIISAFDHDSSSILSGSFYESSCEVLPSEITTKGILKSSEFICRHGKINGNQIRFQEIEIFYFNRQQSFCSVPSVGGSALGMDMQHFLSEKFVFDRDVEVFRNRNKYEGILYEKNSKYPKEDYSTLQPIVAKHRRILLKNSGTSRIETVDKEVCDLIRSSRERCGCQCVAGQCLPETCSCAQNGIQCQVDRGNFPCCCGPNPCVNPLGRVEFNPIRVRTHFIHTIMRLQMQDQYQPDEHKKISKCSEYTNNEYDETAKEFDINTCNSTDQGSCRDCQNDKYLHVLMNEWTHQLQKLHTYKNYNSTVTPPYNSWTYIPESISSTAYGDKDMSMVPVIPYSHYAVSNLPSLNFGIHHVNYHTTPAEPQSRLDTSIYSNNINNNNNVQDNFNSRSNNVHFPQSEENFVPINYTKHKSQNISHLKPNSVNDSVKMDYPITSSTYPPFQSEKHSIYSSQSHEKELTYLCKHSTYSSSLQSDLKDVSYPPHPYVHTVPYCPSKAIPEISLTDPYEPPPSLAESRTFIWNNDSRHNKVTHASNGQLYTVLQPVSESGIVSTFYQNSQASDLCKICKYKSTDIRQRLDHFCVPGFSVTRAVSSDLQLSRECSEQSKVCA